MRRIVAVNTWRIAPGRLPEALGFAETASKIHERLGAQPGTLVPVAGGDPNTLLYTLQFDDIEAYSKFVKKLEDDSDWNTLIKGITAAIQENPGTELQSTVLLSEPWIPS
jgi:hypothetical protein